MKRIILAICPGGVRLMPAFVGLLLAGILFSTSGFAQEVRGTVKDSTGGAVPYASVNLRNRSGDAIVAYTSTDTRGGYALRLPVSASPDSFYLEVRCIGFKTQSKSLTGSPRMIDFTLAISASQLQSVIVRSSRPKLRTSGDTLSYTASDFANAQDRVIGDVIKRLPGIAVAADGTISYNNKPVSGVYLGGDNLLDDKYTIATNSIPQGAVDQVQVIDNHQPIKVLQNKVTSDDVALNLTFKKSAKLRPLGQETAGAGLPGNYYADFNALFLKDQYKAINYLKGNNTGEDLQQELVSHNIADYKQRIGNDPPATVLSLGAVNDPALSRDRYFFDRSGLLNANNLVNFKNGLQLRVNASYLHDTEKQDYSQSTSVFLPGDTVQYTETQHNRFEPDLLHTQFTLNVNTEKYFLNDALVLDDNRWTDHSDLNTNGSAVHQVFRDDLLSLSNEFNGIRPTRSNNLIQVYSYVSHLSEPENRTIGPAYNAQLFNDGAAYAQLVQQVNVPSWYTNNYVSFKMPGDIGTKSFRTGFSVQSQQLGSALSVQQLNNTTNPAFDSAINHLDWTRKKFYAEAAYDIPGDELKANLTMPLILQQIDYSDTGYALSRRLGRLYFNPQLSVKYKTGIENFVTLLFRYRNETGGIEDLYHGYILKDYRTLYANNADLTLRQNLLAAAGFNYRKALTLFFFSINGSYNRIGANNIASGIINNNFQQLVVLPYPNATDAWTLDGTVSKYSFAWRTTFSGEVKWQDNRSVQLQNGAFLPFNTTVGTVTLGAATKLSDQLNFSYHLTGTQTSAHSPAEVAAARVDQLLQQAEIDYIPSDLLQFKLSGEDYFTHSQGSPDLTYFFADASAKYRFKKRKIDLVLDAANFLNVTRYKALYLSANTLTASSYTLPGRIVLLKVMFSL
jgi:Carboxypeptidase regulatory-like domain